MTSYDGLHPTWIKFAKHMQSQARRNLGTCVVHVKVVVDQNGCAKYWPDPEVVRLNPRTEAKEILDSLTGE